MSRFRVIDGGPAAEPEPQAPRPRVGKPRAKGETRPYACRECSDSVQYEFSALIQVRKGTVEDGRNIYGGSLWWACARCHGLKFFIRHCR